MSGWSWKTKAVSSTAILLVIFIQAFCKEEKYTPPPDRGDIAEQCSRNAHFTDPYFTCCEMKRVEVPSFLQKENLVKCFSGFGAGDKVVKTAWTAFKCIVDQQLAGKPLTSANFAEFMLKDFAFSDGVKNRIRNYLKDNLTDYAPFSKVTELGDLTSYANIWKAYYIAENWACTEPKQTQRMLLPSGPDARRCFGWMDQSYRRGDCCGGVPIPFQLTPDPILPAAERFFGLKNWTAFHLMNIPGQYNWENSSVVDGSEYIATCEKAAKFILLKDLTLKEFKEGVESLKAPNYEGISDKLIVPKFFEGKIRRGLIEGIANETAIHADMDVAKFNDSTLSAYSYVYADEWKEAQYKENVTRTLIWTCSIYNVLTQRYKDSLTEELCY